MEEKYIKFYKMFDRRFKNVILCSNTLCDGRVDPHLEFLFRKIEKNNTQQKRI